MERETQLLTSKYPGVFGVFAANFTSAEHAVMSCLLFMDFAVRPGFSEDGKKIVLVAQGRYFARVALEDIRKEFGFRVQDELLHDLASQREVNRRTLSEIATKLFEAEQYSLIQGYLPVADINRSDLAARKNQFAWGRSPFPEVMGIVGPDPPKISASERKENQECDIVDRLLTLLGHSQFSLSNPSAKGESGADVLARFDDSQIGFQVTQYHFDAALNLGKTGSGSRGKESRRSSVGLLTPMFINPFSVAALAHVLREKAKKGWSAKEFPDMRLVVAASIPQDGGTAATWLQGQLLNVDEMNAQLPPILERTKYSAAYIYIMMSGSVYEWKRETGWQKLL